MLSRAFGALILAAFAAAQFDQIPLANPSHFTLWTSTIALGFDLNLDALRLVQFSLDAEPEWLTEREKLQAKAMGRDFMDITDTPFLGSSKKPSFSYPAPNSTIVRDVLPHLSTAEPRANLEHFTSYYTRYYNSDPGKASSEWLYAKILAYTELASEEQKPLISVESLKHPWKQNSIIIRIAPLAALQSDPITIVGAHIDSINHANPFLRAPGAGDDGSGTVTILEAYRGLLVAGYIPVSPLEFHFYAGEEGGLLGSQAIASSYENAEKVVRGMIQFDMTAFHKAGTREEIAVITNENQIDDALTEFLVLVIRTIRYDKKKWFHDLSMTSGTVDIPLVRDVYPGPPGPSSDHASWKKAGYPTSHTLEGQFKNSNSHIHGVEDRIDITPEFSFDHALHFSKLAVAFAIELSSY
ncbi:peptidase [Mycena alexandri]|uniref:Peptide hydrolase n=1 Tax=Mycena alexandri TaxID=1745969 RepID=A0AAD6T850_9AGAR|nr:peptidase [Mycena alexandri]